LRADVSTDVAKLDSLGSLVDAFGGVVAVPLVDGFGVAAVGIVGTALGDVVVVDVIGTAVVVVAGVVAAVDTTMTVDLTDGVATVDFEDVVTTVVDTVGAATVIDAALVVDAVGVAMTVDGVDVVFFIAGAVAVVVSDASSKITTASRKSINISGMSALVSDAGVAGCCFCAAGSAAV